MAKETPWLEIKTAFLKGVTAKELAAKYKIKARSITDKAYEERWGHSLAVGEYIMSSAITANKPL